MPGKKVLMVAYYYPPMAAAGTHRSLHFSREWARLGWAVTVMASSGDRWTPRDPGLLDRVPPEVRVVRVPSFDPVERLVRLRACFFPRRGRAGSPAPGTGGGDGTGPSRSLGDYLSRLLKTPDSMLAFAAGTVLRGIPLMMARRPDVLYSSAPPFSCHLAALWLHRLFAVPWIADFRDPWTCNPFNGEPDYPSLRALNRMLEAGVVREADLVVTNTSAVEADFRRRFPHRDRFVTLTNGFDPALPERLRSLEGEGTAGTSGRMHVVHAGEVYGLRSPRHLVEALAGLKARVPGEYGRLAVSFVGKVHEEEALRAQARSLGVEEALRFEGVRPHQTALRLCAGADILLVLGVMGKEPEVQVPSKLFEYLPFRKPILALAKEGGAIHGLLEESGVTYLLADLEDGEAIERALRRAVQGDFDGRGGWEGMGRFAFDGIARRLSGMMEALKRGVSPNDSGDDPVMETDHRA